MSLLFGETNAGKSTIIESLRILYREKPSQISQIDNNADGLIVGDGRSDFTKVYNGIIYQLMEGHLH